jgi:hypothetical protein
VANFLTSFYDVLFALVEHIPHNSERQDHLINVLLELRKLPSETIGTLDVSTPRSCSLLFRTDHVGAGTHHSLDVTALRRPGDTRCLEGESG